MSGVNIPAGATQRVSIVHLEDNPQLPGYNEGLDVGMELYASEISSTGSVSIYIPFEGGFRESALFKGEFVQLGWVAIDPE